MKIKKSKLSPLVDAVKKNDPENWSFKTDISNYYNAIWCMVVTMATVGFGDFAPKTMPGRMLGFCICIYGVVGVSLMVLTLQNLLTLSFRENRVGIYIIIYFIIYLGNATIRKNPIFKKKKIICG